MKFKPSSVALLAENEIAKIFLSLSAWKQNIVISEPSGHLYYDTDRTLVDIINHHLSWSWCWEGFLTGE